MQWIIRQDAADGAAWFVILGARMSYIINNPLAFTAAMGGAR
jgi:hypothetical protein